MTSMERDNESGCNHLGQPVGVPVPDWTAPNVPLRAKTLKGRFCRLEALDVTRHGEELRRAYAVDEDGRVWTYLPVGPFFADDDNDDDDNDDNDRSFWDWLERSERSTDPLFFAIIDVATDRAVGVSSYLRINATMGSVEVGYLAYSPLLQRTVGATEAMYLMMKNAFDVGYRRYEWKCDSLNGPSRTAAYRLGFSYEGTFRQHLMYKGRNRDTSWFSIVDAEWPPIQEAFETWLDPDNFEEGTLRQKIRLSDLTAPLVKRRQHLDEIEREKET